PPADGEVHSWTGFYAGSGPTLQLDGRNHTPGGQSAVIADRRLPPRRQCRPPGFVEQTKLIEDRHGRRMQAARVAVDHLESYPPATASDTDRLAAFGADLGHPVASAGAHQAEVVAPLPGDHFRMGGHRRG